MLIKNIFAKSVSINNYGGHKGWTRRSCGGRASKNFIGDSDPKISGSVSLSFPSSIVLFQIRRKFLINTYVKSLDRTFPFWSVFYLLGLFSNKIPVYWNGVKTRFATKWHHTQRIYNTKLVYSPTILFLFLTILLYRVPQFRWESQRGVIVFAQTNKKVHVHIQPIIEIEGG